LPGGGSSGRVPEAVDCSECGTRYDSQEHPFCPRCGSTSRGATLPGAVAAAARRDPGRRRVQGAGAVLLAIGGLFLVSGIVNALQPPEETAAAFGEGLNRLPGGELVVVFPADGNATVEALDSDGDVVANATGAGGSVRLALPAPALDVRATQGNATWNRTVVIQSGDVTTLELAEGEPDLATPVISRSMRTVVRVSNAIAIGTAVVLAGGGASAMGLRFFGAAATAAVVALLIGLVAVFALVAFGLLFAIPLGMAAYFILRGRRHFRARTPPTPPAGSPPSPPSPPR
jgi:hypothetical protein